MTDKSKEIKRLFRERNKYRKSVIKEWDLVANGEAGQISRLLTENHMFRFFQEKLEEEFQQITDALDTLKGLGLNPDAEEIDQFFEDNCH